MTNDIRILIYAIIILTFTSFLLQYPFHLQYYNQINDAKDYMQASRWLFESEHFASASRPFLFPLLIGIPYLFGLSDSEYFVAILNFLFWLCTIGLLYNIVKNFASEKISFIISTIFASCLSLHCYMFFITTENFYTFLLMAHVSTIYKYITTLNSKWLYLSIWLLGATVVVRPTLTYFVLASLLVVVLFTIFKKISFKKFLIITFLLFSTIGIQSINMYRSTGSLKVSYIGHLAWYLYSGAYSINLLKYPNQSIDFYAKKWADEKVTREKINLSIFNEKRNYSKLPEIEKIINQDIKMQFSENKAGITFTFLRNLFVNSRSGTQYVISAINGFQIPYFSLFKTFFLKISQIQNILNSFLVLIFLPIFFIFQYKQLKKRDKDAFYVALYSWTLAFSIMMFSTASFTQGDRFHVVTVPLTLFSVSLIFFSKKRTLNASYN